MDMDTLLNFSGGIDSTYCLWRYLKENRDKTLLVHHIHLENNDRRVKYESLAVDNVLSWLRSQGLTNFKYIESRLDYGTIHPIVWDSAVVGFFTGLVLTNRKYELKYIISPTPKDEVERLGAELERRRVKSSLVRKSISQKELEVLFPMVHLYKKDIIQEMPEELFRLCWYCRHPKNGNVCNRCHTCLQVNSALEG